jgi:hypothetical protein
VGCSAPSSDWPLGDAPALGGSTLSEDKPVATITWIRPSSPYADLKHALVNLKADTRAGAFALQSDRFWASAMRTGRERRPHLIARDLGCASLELS